MKLPAFAICLTTACACVDDAAVGETTQAVVEANGVSLNGVSLNGVSLNGVSLNGVSLNGVSLNGVSLNGVSLNGVSLNGVSLNGVSLNGSSLTGVRSDNGELLTVDASDVTLTALLSNGATLALRVDRVSRVTSDLWAYGISYASDKGWSPLCGAGIEALAVPGTWNTEAGVPGGGAYTSSSDAFTFACRGKTIAKCVELGYKPWLGRAAHMQSCVRALRGDYCGDGTPYTTTGYRVNMYDSLGVQKDTEQWVPEAEWTPAGARCVTEKAVTRASESGYKMPCTARMTHGCGQDGLRNGTHLMMTETPTDTAKTEPARAQR